MTKPDMSQSNMVGQENVQEMNARLGGQPGKMMDSRMMTSQFVHEDVSNGAPLYVEQFQEEHKAPNPMNEFFMKPKTDNENTFPKLLTV